MKSGFKRLNFAPSAPARLPGPFADLLRLRQVGLGQGLVPGVEIEGSQTVVAGEEELGFPRPIAAVLSPTPLCPSYALSLLGLTFGLDVKDPALKLPGAGRVGIP